MRRIRRKSSNPFKVLVILIFVLLVLDAAVRLILPSQNINFNINRPKEYQELFVPGEFGRLQSNLDKTVTYNATTFNVTTNHFGMRSPEVSVEKENAVSRITVLGDSVSFGWMMEEDHSYPALLRNKLDEKYPGQYQVLNFSAPGFSSVQGRYIFESVVQDFNPDVLILSFGLYDSKSVFMNDLLYIDLLREHGFLHSSLWKTIFSQYSTIGNWWIHQSQEALLEEITPSHSAQENSVRVEPDEAQQALQSVIESMQASGEKTILLDTNIHHHYLSNVLNNISMTNDISLISVHDFLANVGRAGIKKIRYQKALAYPGNVQMDDEEIIVHFRCFVPNAAELTLGVQSSEQVEWFDLNDSGMNGDEKADDAVWSIDITRSEVQKILYAFYESKPDSVDEYGLIREPYAWPLQEEEQEAGYKTILPLRQYGALPHHEFRMAANPEYPAQEVHVSIANRLYGLIVKKN